MSTWWFMLLWSVMMRMKSTSLLMKMRNTSNRWTIWLNSFSSTTNLDTSPITSYRQWLNEICSLNAKATKRKWWDKTKKSGSGVVNWQSRVKWYQWTTRITHSVPNHPNSLHVEQMHGFDSLATISALRDAPLGSRSFWLRQFTR